MLSRHQHSIRYLTTPRVKTIIEEQLNDGFQHCLHSTDENCGWKDNLNKWVNPLKSEKFQEYFNFLQLLENNPSATRWFTMATVEEIKLLGHRYEVSEELCIHCFATRTNPTLDKNSKSI